MCLIFQSSVGLEFSMLRFDHSYHSVILVERIVVSSTIWYHMYNLKSAKDTHAGVLLLAKLGAKAYNFTKSNTPPRVFFTFFKILQMVPNNATHLILCFFGQSDNLQIITLKYDEFSSWPLNAASILP